MLRKVRSARNRLLLQSRLSSYYHLSKKRIRVDKSFKAGSGFSIQSDLSESFISVDENVSARDDFKILIGHNGRLNIGKRNFFNNGCSLNCLGIIEIGNDNQFGENVLFYDHNHRYSDKNQLISQQGYNIGKIKIGNNCWVGSNVVILKDVEIGDGAVIGAGCVIHKSVQPGLVVINHQNLSQQHSRETS